MKLLLMENNICRHHEEEGEENEGTVFHTPLTYNGVDHTKVHGKKGKQTKQIFVMSS